MSHASARWAPASSGSACPERRSSSSDERQAMTPLTTDLDMLLRLGGATLAGAIIGLNRELTHKPAGLRTHALVALGAAVITLFSVSVVSQSGTGDDGEVLRTIQGIITGIGFIG